MRSTVSRGRRNSARRRSSTARGFGGQSATRRGQGDVRGSSGANCGVSAGGGAAVRRVDGGLSSPAFGVERRRVLERGSGE